MASEEAMPAAEEDQAAVGDASVASTLANEEAAALEEERAKHAARCGINFPQKCTLSIL